MFKFASNQSLPYQKGIGDANVLSIGMAAKRIKTLFLGKFSCKDTRGGPQP